MVPGGGNPAWQEKPSRVELLPVWTFNWLLSQRSHWSDASYSKVYVTELMTFWNRCHSVVIGLPAEPHPVWEVVHTPLNNAEWVLNVVRTLMLFKTCLLYQICYTQIEIFQAYNSWVFVGLQIMKTQNSVTQKIRILHNLNLKRNVLSRNVQLLKSLFSTWLGLLCMSYCLGVVWRGGDRPAALLRCNQSPACFDGSRQVFCIVGSLLFLLTKTHSFPVASDQASVASSA